MALHNPMVLFPRDILLGVNKQQNFLFLYFNNLKLPYLIHFGYLLIYIQTVVFQGFNL